jgi:hypothetical protein
MTKKEFRPITSDWLRGKEELALYLGIEDVRTIDKYLGKLLPDAHLGKMVYYHKRSVDRFMFNTMKGIL